jgi:hypothetical protein
MHKPVRALLAGFAVGVLFAFVPSCGTKAAMCDANNCPNGCCDDQMQCRTPSDLTCGGNGNTCKACESGKHCLTGTCVSGGNGGGNGGGSATGGGNGGSGGGSATGGGTGGSGGGSTGGGSGGGDAGTDAGASCNGPSIPLLFAASCPVFTPCGGNVVGTWTYDGGCVPDDAFTPLITQFNMLCGVAPDGGSMTTTISDKTGNACGSLTFTSTELHRNVLADVTFTVTNIGSTCIDPGYCSIGDSLLPTYGLSGHCQTNTAGDACICTNVKFNLNSLSSDTYTLNANTITTGGGRSYDYCVSGGVFTYVETTMSTSTFADPGIYTLK